MPTLLRRIGEAETDQEKAFQGQYDKSLGDKASLGDFFFFNLIQKTQTHFHAVSIELGVHVHVKAARALCQAVL